MVNYYHLSAFSPCDTAIKIYWFLVPLSHYRELKENEVEEMDTDDAEKVQYEEKNLGYTYTTY